MKDLHTWIDKMECLHANAILDCTISELLLPLPPFMQPSHQIVTVPCAAKPMV
jgi:hypothetical protein